MTAVRPSLSVGRLTLDVPAMSDAQARTLAALVADALQRWPSLPAGGSVAHVDVTVPVDEAHPRDDADLARLAHRIARSVLSVALAELPS